MSWGEDLRAGLGPPRGDEPAALRDDIADELADHLSCSLRQELRRTDDEAAAERLVLERFGDPRALARQLWWQAMKETIMKERVLMGAVAVLALVSLAACLLAWSALRQGREVDQAILLTLAQMREAQPAAAAAPPAAVTPESAGWSRLALRLVDKAEGGKPVAGAKVELHGNPFPGPSGGQILRATSDGRGVIEFGPIQAGSYALTTSRDGVETGQIRDVVLFAGQRQERTIVVPPLAEVVVEFKLPSDLIDARAQVLVNFARISEDETVRSSQRAVFPVESAHAVNITSGKPLRDLGAMQVGTIWPAGRYRLQSIVITDLGARVNPVSSGRNPRALHAIRNLATQTAPRFDAVPSAPNRWVVELPEDLLREVRQKIAAGGPSRTSAPRE